MEVQYGSAVLTFFNTE